MSVVVDWKPPIRIDSVDRAREEVGPITRADWLEQQLVFPFDSLSPEAFELLVYSLLSREHPADDIYYSAGVGDLGRDIVHRAARGDILVQCKRYQSNVRLPDIRCELAKLCTNIESGAIAPAPSQISFYVSRDLTSPAAEFVRSPDLWRKAARGALTDHLGKDPSPVLLTFADSWWPAIDHVSGFDLTQRLRTHQDLVEQFFRLRTVIDATQIDALAQEARAGISTVLAGHAEILAAIKAESTAPDPFAQIRELLARAEQENPNLDIRMESDARGHLWRIRAKPGADPLSAGTVRFPATEAGARGRAKFERMLDAGEAITLAFDECIWEPKHSIRLDSSHALIVSKLLITPTAPDYRAMVDLRAGDAEIRNLSLRIERAGRTESVLVFEQSALGLKLRLTARRGIGASVDVEFDFGGLAPDRAARLAEFMIACQQCPVRVLDAERDEPLMEMSELTGGWDPSHLGVVRDYAMALARINGELGTAFSFPAEIVDTDLNNACVLATAIEKRRPVRIEGGPMSMHEVPKDEAEQLLAAVRAGRPMSFSLDAEMRLFDVKLDVGLLSLILPSVVPTMPIEELAAIVAALDPDEKLSTIELRPIRVYSFARWNGD